MNLLDEFLERARARKLVEFDAGLSKPVYLRPINNAVKSKIETIMEKETKSARDRSEIRWLAIQDCLVNELGEPMLTPEHRQLYDAWDQSFTEPIFEKILQISRQSAEEIDEIKN